MNLCSFIADMIKGMFFLGFVKWVSPIQVRLEISPTYR